MFISPFDLEHGLWATSLALFLPICYTAGTSRRRYGLIGPNGCGKSTLLASLAAREVPCPEHIDIFHLDREAPATDMSSLEMVMSVDEERLRLEKEAEHLAELDMSPDIEARMQDVYDR